MSARELFFTLSTLLGGLAVFILGMGMMTDALRRVAETRVRSFLSRVTRLRVVGLALGTVMGFLAHSSAASVVFVGLVNAGLMTLAQSLPPMLGAGIGTSLSMQLISFSLGHYSYLIIGIGFLMKVLVPSRRAKEAGGAILGFGLLFLGMQTMSDAIAPHREALTPLLSRIDGRSLGGMLSGLAIATLFTMVIQSSGATIGICFVLCQSGVFQDLTQVYPVVLGAQVGTCISALLASIGAGLEARRAAVAHLLYRLLNAGIAVAAAPVVVPLILKTSSDLVHQAANMNTLVMLAGAVIFMPLVRPLAWTVRVITPSRRPEAPSSYLDDALLDRPEMAISASIRELQRVARIALVSFRRNAVLFFRSDRRQVMTIKLNEQAVDQIKARMKTYVGSMAMRKLSRRQAILVQYLDRCMIHLERMADHIDAICDVSQQRLKEDRVRFDRPTLRQWFSLYREVDRILTLVIESLNADLEEFADTAEGIVKTRETFLGKCRTFNHFLVEKLSLREFQPITGVYLNQYVSFLKRIVRHAEAIATTEQKPEFFIKRSKLDHVAARIEGGVPPPPENPEDYLQYVAKEEVGT